jgi:hypothetical protein
MSTYQRIAELPLHIEDYSFEGLSRQLGEFNRRTTIIRLRGDGLEGAGEDVGWDGELQRSQQERDPGPPLAGAWTFDAFSRHLAELELFPGEELAWEVLRNYRRWAYESAALDLALRQAGRSLADVLEREPRPISFVVSNSLSDPPTFEPCERRIAAYPGVRFKLDATPAWTDDLIGQLAASGAVPVIDFKGAYRGTAVDVETDPDLYGRVAAALPEAVLEDPDLTVPEADAALRPYRDRISWDAVIHSVDDILALPFPPRVLNIKPSRIGSLRALFDTYDYCREQGIRTYGGGMGELGLGRGQIHCLASLFHADGPNDIAPSGYDWVEFPLGLPLSPLEPKLDTTGFRRDI